MIDFKNEVSTATQGEVMHWMWKVLIITAFLTGGIPGIVAMVRWLIAKISKSSS